MDETKSLKEAQARRDALQAELWKLRRHEHALQWEIRRGDRSKRETYKKELKDVEERKSRASVLWDEIEKEVDQLEKEEALKHPAKRKVRTLADLWAFASNFYYSQARKKRK